MKMLLTPQFILVYVLACIVVGLFGRDRRAGFWGFVLFSLVLTPLIAGFFLVVAAPIKVKPAPTASKSAPAHT